MQVLVPMAGLIDTGAERVRLDKEIQRIADEIKRVDGKLSNHGFVAKAPEEVIEAQRVRLADLEQGLASMTERRKRIDAL